VNGSVVQAASVAAATIAMICFFMGAPSSRE
jgi:hypothetical protein